MTSLSDSLEQYFEYLVGNKITIISEIQESPDGEYYTFRYCLFYNYTETDIAEINKKDYIKWKSQVKIIYKNGKQRQFRHF